MTKEQRIQAANDLFAKHEILLCNLADRWHDEQEYEDFEDYKKLLIKNIPNVLKVTKRPFGVIVRVADFPYDVHLYVSATQAGWKSVSRKP